MKVLLLVNPYASGVSSKKNRYIRNLLRGDFELTEKFTAERGHATELARDAAHNGTDVVFVLGGDGTLNEVINGLRGSKVVMAPLPGGSTNVFVRSLGLPAKPVPAAKRLIELLNNWQVSHIGLGSVNGRSFLFHAGVGFDAAVVKQVERKGDLKRWLRHPLYVFKATSTLLRHYRPKTKQVFMVEAEPAGRVAAATGRAAAAAAGRIPPADPQPEPQLTPVGPMCLVLNTSPYTYLGNRPLNVAPDASLAHELVFVGLKSLGALTLLRLVRKAVRGNRSVSQDKAVDYRTAMTRFALTADNAIPWQVDGDYAGEAMRWEFAYRPECLWLLDPQATPQDRLQQLELTPAQ